MDVKLPEPVRTAGYMSQRRVHCRLSQDDLAALLGTTRPTISRMERGALAISPARAMHMALLFAWLDPAGGAVLACYSINKRHMTDPKPTWRARPGVTRRWYGSHPDESFLPVSDARKLPLGARYYRIESDNGTEDMAIYAMERTATNIDDDKILHA